MIETNHHISFLAHTDRHHHHMPSDLKFIPSSGTFTQNCSSERRHDTMASMAFVMARSMPFSLTKKVCVDFGKSCSGGARRRE